MTTVVATLAATETSVVVAAGVIASFTVMVTASVALLTSAKCFCCNGYFVGGVKKHHVFPGKRRFFFNVLNSMYFALSLSLSLCKRALFSLSLCKRAHFSLSICKRTLTFGERDN